MLTGSSDTQCITWDFLTTYDPINVFTADSGITSLALSKDNLMVAIGLDSQKVILLDIKQGTVLGSFNAIVAGITGVLIDYY